MRCGHPSRRIGSADAPQDEGIISFTGSEEHRASDASRGMDTRHELAAILRVAAPRRRRSAAPPATTAKPLREDEVFLASLGLHSPSHMIRTSETRYYSTSRS